VTQAGYEPKDALVEWEIRDCLEVRIQSLIEGSDRAECHQIRCRSVPDPSKSFSWNECHFSLPGSCVLDDDSRLRKCLYDMVPLFGISSISGVCSRRFLHTKQTKQVHGNLYRARILAVEDGDRCIIHLGCRKKKMGKN